MPTKDDLNDSISQDTDTGAVTSFSSNSALSASDEMDAPGTDDLADSQGQDGPSSDPSSADPGTVTPDTRGVIGADGRSRVTNTKASEPRKIVAIQFAEHGSTRMSQCTGNLVAPILVLTAGHCVYSNNGWHHLIRVTPGKNGFSNPYGGCNAKKLYTVKGWYNSSNQRNGTTNGNDYGAIKLNGSIGNTVGWMGFSSSGVVGRSVRITGYPGEKPYFTMWTEAGKIAKKSDHVFYTYIDFTPGQSGSGMYGSGCGNWCIYGIATATGNPNFTVRVTNSVVKNVKAWKK